LAVQAWVAIEHMPHGQTSVAYCTVHASNEEGWRLAGSRKE